jgi:hippurate hydrolase
MNAETRLRMIAEIETTAKNATAALGCDVSMELRPGYPPTLNHESDALFARDIITDMLGADGLETDMTPVMGAEDFSFMLEKKPGAYVWLGAGLQSENLHSPHFDFNDDLLPIGASFWVQLAQSKLTQST